MTSPLATTIAQDGNAYNAIDPAQLNVTDGTAHATLTDQSVHH